MRLASLILLSLLLCISSCKSDDEMEKEGNCLTAKINGEEFIAETTVGVFVDTQIEYENLGLLETKFLTITGTIPSLSAETKTIKLVFACSEFTSNLDVVTSDSDCGIGLTYEVTSFTDPNNPTVIIALEGNINVEEVTDEMIRGTFSFQGEDQNGTTYNITNGFFDTTIES